MQARVLRGGLRRLVCAILEASGPDYDIAIDGIKLRCHLGDNVSDRSVIARGFTQRGLALVVQALRQGDVFVDVGANCGVFTAVAATCIGPSGRIVAIEPNPTMASRLRFNLAANGMDGVSVIEAAISDSDGCADLRLPAENAGAATLSGGPSSAMTRPVPTMTLASAVASLPRIDVLKIDIEGHEDRALLPYIAKAAPAMWPTHILIEHSHSDRWRSDCITVLGDAGYKTAWRDSSNALLHLGC